MTAIERALDQLRRAFSGDAWHGPELLELLDGVDARQAASRPLANAHSIWEIVLHISAWEEAVCRRLGGEVAEPTGEQDWPPVGDTSDAAWQFALQSLNSGHAALERAVAALPDSRLPDTVPGNDYSVYFMLHGVVQHDLYHAGQIAILKKGAP
jgi:uncharacterized damage-inducible protein DinB